MKKILIPAFFLGIILVTYVVAKAATSIRLNEKDIIFETHKNTLSDNEINSINESGLFINPLPIGRPNVEECFDLKETRTRSLFSWELKVDTLKRYITITSAKDKE